MTDEFLIKNKIDFIAHDDLPYTSDDSQDIYAKFKERGMFVATDRTEGKPLENPLTNIRTRDSSNKKNLIQFILFSRSFHFRYCGANCERL